VTCNRNSHEQDTLTIVESIIIADTGCNDSRNTGSQNNYRPMGDLYL